MVTLVDVVIRPFGSTFLIVPTPPTNIKKKIPLTQDMDFETLKNALTYDMPLADIKITFEDNGK